MTFAEAKRRVHERTTAVSGGLVDPEQGRNFAPVAADNDTLIRGMLSGLIDGEDLDELLEGLDQTTGGALHMLALAATTGGHESMANTLRLAFTQMVATGLLLADAEVRS